MQSKGTPNGSPRLRARAGHTRPSPKSTRKHRLERFARRRARAPCRPQASVRRGRVQGCVVSHMLLRPPPCLRGQHMQWVWRGRGDRRARARHRRYRPMRTAARCYRRRWSGIVHRPRGGHVSPSDRIRARGSNGDAREACQRRSWCCRAVRPHRDPTPTAGRAPSGPARGRHGT